MPTTSKAALLLRPEHEWQIVSEDPMCNVVIQTDAELSEQGQFALGRLAENFLERVLFLVAEYRKPEVIHHG